MANPMTSFATRNSFDAAPAAAMNPASLQRYRLDRLLELRAVIDALRAERGHETPPPARCAGARRAD
jgi:hypothetical protein